MKETKERIPIFNSVAYFAGSSKKDSPTLKECFRKHKTLVVETSADYYSALNPFRNDKFKWIGTVDAFFQNLDYTLIRDLTTNELILIKDMTCITEG